MITDEELLFFQDGPSVKAEKLIVKALSGQRNNATKKSSKEQLVTNFKSDIIKINKQTRGMTMEKEFESAKFTIEYGIRNDLDSPILQLNSATIPIEKEHVVELLEWFEEKGYFTGHLRELAHELGNKRKGISHG